MPWAPRGHVDRAKLPSRGYTREWRRLSREARERQPWCSVCRSPNDLTVDHIVGLAAGGTNDPTNLRVLCRPCHGRKSYRDRGPWAR